MERQMEGKVCVITDACSVTGPAIARRFAAEGGKVVLAASGPEQLQQLMDEIHTHNGEGLAVVADVAVYNQVRNVVERAIETFGRVDVLVNNAGLLSFKDLEDTSPQEIDDQIDAELKSVVYGTKAALGPMRAQGAGHIVNVGTTSRVQDSATSPIHDAARHAVFGFSVTLYEEVKADGIRVNVLCPPPVRMESCEDAGSAGVSWVPEELISPDDMAELAANCVAGVPEFPAQRVVVWPAVQTG